MLDILKKLTDVCAPSGSENLLYDIIKSEIEPFVDEIKTDALGNLIAHKKGEGEKVLFAAHLDEIGLICTYITDEGFLKVEPIGGVSPYTAAFSRVRFTNGVMGVVGVAHTGDNTMKNLKISDLYVDIGAKNKEEAQKYVSVGDTMGFVGEFFKTGDCVVSKSMDNRAGCAVLIDAIKQIESHKNDLFFVFTYGEELGLRGARTAAFSINPTYAVAIDVTKTGDCPGKLKMAVNLGNGAAIKIKDSSVMCHPYMKNLMFDTAKKYNIPHQAEVLEQGGTDIGAIHITADGAIGGAISIPTRYIHTPSEMVNVNDLRACADLTARLIEEGFNKN